MSVLLNGLRRCLAIVPVFLLAGPWSAREAVADAPAVRESQWNGFQRLDFVVDGRNCLLVLPKTPADSRPWIWRTEFFGHEPQADIALLDRGFHVAYMDVQNMYGAPIALDHMDRFYDWLTQKRGLASKTVLEGFSRGGLFAFNWAARHPDRVASLYVDAPVCDFKSWPGGKGRGKGSPGDWQRCLGVYGLTEEQALAYRFNPVDNLEPLAKARVPLLHVCGEADTVVPIDENSRLVEKRYRQLGGEVLIISKPFCEHHPHSLKDPGPIVDFILRHWPGLEPLARPAPAAPLEKSTIEVISSRDNTAQKALFYVPPEATLDKQGDPVPLLVGLHSWSSSYQQTLSLVPEAQQRKWVFIGPDFRGPNRRPEACASDLAVQDILDAAEYARRNARVDDSRIYLFGSSGGGHMALMMAARAPAIWAGVSAWVPISDLAAWHGETLAAKRPYAAMLEAVCGGAPGTPATDAQYRARSPLGSLAAAKGLPFDLNAGIHDGYTGSVPISHTLRAFNVLAEANGQPARKLSDEEIATMTREQKVPAGLAGQAEADPERAKPVLFRRQAGPARVTIFEGGHDEDLPAALAWLSRQRKSGQQ